MTGTTWTRSPSGLLGLRLAAQGLEPPPVAGPADVVRRLGAIQAQDYAGALWAIGLRTRRGTQRDVEQAIAERSIVRTWPMRGTLHFVAAQDARWMLQLLTPRILAGSRARLQREYGLDERAVGRARDTVVRALDGGRRLSRDAIYRVLEGRGISTSGQRGVHILWRLAHEPLICFGPRDGKHPTFVLVDEWLPPERPLARDEALATLARRYFTSHGPATLHDFAWWSGLTVADARRGLEPVRRELAERGAGAATRWFDPTLPVTGLRPRGIQLLPPYDEYTVGYRDRSAAIGAADARRPEAGYGIARPLIIRRGRAVGTWSRRLQKGSVLIETRAPGYETGSRALVSTARRLAEFLGVEVDVR